MEIGNLESQIGGYKAFIPAKFPPEEILVLSARCQSLNAEASLALGKLDGIAQLIPDINFFTLMYVRKEAVLSSNIEGTKATMHDSLKADIKITEGVPKDVENITHYISAMVYGVERFKRMPLSLRMIRELHHELLDGTAEGAGKTPGEFRTSQNWINGTRPDNAEFVPPPPQELARSLKDFEDFVNTSHAYPPLVKAALMHAQFETIHPFLDGNGRTGRLLITLLLCYEEVLEFPILYLSEYFKRHREVYFARLSGYHNQGLVEPWVEFFLEGVKDVAIQAAETSKKIVRLREQDMVKVHSMGSKKSSSAVTLLLGLFSQPFVDIARVQEITNLSRPAANSLVKKFVEAEILVPTDESATYGRQFSYDAYIRLFV